MNKISQVAAVTILLLASFVKAQGEDRLIRKRPVASNLQEYYYPTIRVKQKGEDGEGAYRYQILIRSINPLDKFTLYGHRINSSEPFLEREISTGKDGRPRYYEAGQWIVSDDTVYQLSDYLAGEPCVYRLVRKRDSQEVAKQQVIPNPIAVSLGASTLALTLLDRINKKFLVTVKGMTSSGKGEALFRCGNIEVKEDIDFDYAGSALLRLDTAAAAGQAAYFIIDRESGKKLEVTFSIER